MNGEAATEQSGGRRMPQMLNTSNPVPLSFAEALAQLLATRLPRVARGRWSVTAAVALFSVGFVVAPIPTGLVIGGGAAGVILLAALYFWWYARFITRNAGLHTICPSCTSRMWQLCCAGCGIPVPLLGLMLGGALLRRCPHCKARLSCRRGTLLGWCTSCGWTRMRPDRLYSKACRVTVWIVKEFPRSSRLAYEEIYRDGHCLTLFDDASPTFTNVVFVRTDYDSIAPPVPQHLLSHTRLLLISTDVPSLPAERLQGYFGRHTLRGTTPPIG
jgi:hypothetical protein